MIGWKRQKQNTWVYCIPSINCSLISMKYVNKNTVETIRFHTYQIIAQVHVS